MMSRRLMISLMVVFFAVGSVPATGADWPMYRGDIRRSGVSTETIELPLAEHWRYEPSQSPQPAWPDPVKERHRLDFDYAPHLVIAANTVFFGSSADDTLRAIDAEAATIRWTFTTGGPIRFAPAYDSGSIYVTSDDGHLYCLEATTGKLIWDFHAAEKNDQILGNGRLISRWPLRSGVLVDDGVAYLTAGMWPSEGIKIFAIDSTTGDVIWCNDTSDTMYLAQPHAKAFSLTGVSPQGYLLATDKLLFVPTGRGVPAAFDRRTGELAYFKPSDSKTHGGCWATISDDQLFNGGLVYEAATGNQIACPTTKVPLWAKQDFDFGTRQHVLGYRGDRILANGDQILGRRAGYCLALTGDILFEGNDGTLSAFDTKSKNQATVLWETKFPPLVRNLAISGGAVFAATDVGTVHRFASVGKQANSNPTVIKDQQATPGNRELPSDNSRFTDAVLSLAKQASLTKGYTVILGDPHLARSIARQTQVHVLCLLETPAEITKARKRFVEDGIYGTQIAVQSFERLQEGNLPPYFANLVVVGRKIGDLNGETLWNVLRPCGGQVVFDDATKPSIEKLFVDVEDQPVEKGEVDGAFWLKRGKLPGAFDWDSEVTSDQRIKWPLELAWFGGPGPARMQDRHHASIAPPVVANGRYFVPGERDVIAVDAYNGTELWSHRFGDLIVVGEAKPKRLTGLAADDENVYFTTGDGWTQLNAQTGKVVGTLDELPAGLEQWGRLAKRYEPYATALRKHALTGESVPRIYYRAYGCNQVLTSEGVDFFRSGTLGLYDLEDDSGLRNFGGVRPGCWRSHNAAFGVFLSSEGSSGCVCTYNFQTSLMLAPTRRRRNEDWAVYHDVSAAGLVRHLAINFGAPGDRRDEDGRLWLGYPRPQEAIALQLPVSIDASESLHAGPYHHDADRHAVQKTDRPWIYTSGYRGIRKLTIALDQQQPIVSHVRDSAPQIDGQLSSGEWPDEAGATMSPVHDRQNRGAPNRPLINPDDWKSQVRFAHDEQHLYVAFHQENRIDRRGNPYEWRAKTEGTNAPIWQDDSCELFLSDSAHQVVLHFGVSASGATHDAQLQRPDERENAKWDAAWQAKTIADEKAFVVEMAIPWSTLEEAGLSKSHLLVNAQANWSGWNSPVRYLGSQGRLACENFSPLGVGTAPASLERRFRVRLHFAEVGKQTAPPQPIDVLLQGKTLLKGFDIRAEAGVNTAVVKEFAEVAASSTMTIEFIPAGSQSAAENESVLSGVEIEELDWDEASLK